MTEQSTTIDRLTSQLWRRRVCMALAVWAGWYAAYRFYYAFGGDLGMIGRPASRAEFERINFVGGVVILVAAVVPAVAVGLWRHRWVRKVVPLLAWAVAVGCAAHALTDMVGDVLSLTGVHAGTTPLASGHPSTAATPTCKICSSTSRGSWPKARCGRPSASPPCALGRGGRGPRPSSPRSPWRRWSGW